MSSPLHKEKPASRSVPISSRNILINSLAVPKHGLIGIFDERGLKLWVEARNGDSYASRWSLSEFGRGSALTTVSTGELNRDGQRAEIVRPNVTEWFVGTVGWLEHGFTIAERPGGEGDHTKYYIAAADRAFQSYKQSGEAQYYTQHKECADTARQFHKTTSTKGTRMGG